MSDDNLRDTFAAAALTGLLVNANEDIDADALDTPSDIAYTTYQLADAMLAERAKIIAQCDTAQKLSEGDSCCAVLAEYEIDALEYVVERGRIASDIDYGILRSLVVRLRTELERANLIPKSVSVSPAETMKNKGDTMRETDPASAPQVPRKPETDRLAEWERHGSHRWGLGVASDLYDLECRVASLEKTIHDAAPAARAGEASASPERVAHGRDAGTGKQTAPPCVETDAFSSGSRTGQINRTPERQSPDREREESEPLDDTRPGITGEATGGRGQNTLEPVAWAVMDDRGLQLALHPTPEHASYMACTASVGAGKAIPLYRHPPQDCVRVAQLEAAIRRLAEQDAALSLLCKRDGSQVITVTMDATLTDAERAFFALHIERLQGWGRASPESRAELDTVRGLLERLG